jgi:hypothetical protein
MFTSSPNHTNSFLIIYKIVLFKVEEKVFFPYAQGAWQCSEGQNNHFSEVDNDQGTSN